MVALQQETANGGKYDKLPEWLKQNGRFCVWRYEERTDSAGNKSITKSPYNPRTGGGAQSTNPSTFTDFKTACAVANRGRYDGIGVGVFDGLSGVDIDHCITADGELTALGREVMDAMDTYTEVSPSGTGLRLFFSTPQGFSYDNGVYYINNRHAGDRANEKHPGAGYGGEGLEIYVSGMTNKFMTVTGRTIFSRGIEPRADRLQPILDKFMRKPVKPIAETNTAPATPNNIEDAELIERASRARNGAQFERLWNGDTSDYASADSAGRSEADLALCNMLAFWTGRDAQRIDSLFRQSGLMRPKWDSKRGGGTYGSDTIMKAIEGCSEVFTPRTDTPPAAFSVDMEETPTPADSATALDAFLEAVQTERYKPLQTGMQSFDRLLGGGIMRQSLVVLSAAPGTGKTALASQVFERFAANGNPVLFLNLEMSAEYLLARSLSRRLYAGGYYMTATDVLQGYRWSEQQRAHVLEAAAEYRREVAPFLTYNPHGNISDVDIIRGTLMRHAEQAIAEGKPAPVVVLDYLHLLTAHRMDAQEVVKAGIAMLKDYAIRYDTFVLAIAANNREANKSGTITQSSARDSSAIEYTADVQLSLNYKALEDGDLKPNGKDKYRADNPQDMDELMREDPREMVVRVLKNRMAQAGGKLYMDFDAAHSTFTPRDKPKLADTWKAYRQTL